MAETTMQRMHDALQKRQQAQQLRHLRCMQHGAVWLKHGGKRRLNFASNDYLGLSHHPDVLEAARVALEQQHGGAASRLVVGNHPYYAPLERAMASYKKTEHCLVFGSGYAAGVGVVSALAQPGDLIIADREIHACMLDGARLSGAKFLRVRHLDVQAVAAVLEKQRGQYASCFILTETVFSMDGACADIDALLRLAEKYDAVLISDDAHGMGVIAPPPSHSVHVQMGTFSKALGGYGGYVCASKLVCDYLLNYARSFVFSTALPPGVISANMAALTIVRKGKRTVSLQRNIAHFSDLLGPHYTAHKSAVFSIPMQEEERALAMQKQLYDAGFEVGAMRPPTVAPATSRLRIVLQSGHTYTMLGDLYTALKKIGL